MRALTSPFAFDLSVASASAAQSRTSQLESFRASEIFDKWASSPMRPSAVTAAAFGRRICGGARRPPPPTTSAKPEVSSLVSPRSSATAAAWPEAFSPMAASAFAAAALMPTCSLFSRSLILGAESLEAATTSAMPLMAATADIRIELSLSESAATTPLTQVEGALSAIAAIASSAAPFVRPLLSILSRTSPILSAYSLCISNEIPMKVPSASTAALCTSGTGSSSNWAKVLCIVVSSISAMAWQTLMRTRGSESTTLPATTLGSERYGPRCPSASTAAARHSTTGWPREGVRYCSYCCPFGPKRPMTVIAAACTSGS
mmetsp:Transcript_32450/g.89495  ORF Transcript_32450/g.89495 Transcript_32450/m.89495 type:complete len:318 (+) Transcript_32450:799-1752(+)